MSPTRLPASAPAEQGVDADQVQRFLDGVERSAQVELHSLMILRHGHVIAEGWWAPYRRESMHHLYSVSKSFTSAAVGLAVEEGMIALEDPVVEYFPELAADVLDPGTRSMLVRHLLCMASGHRSASWDRVHEMDPQDPVRGFLSLPPDEPPGTVFAYNQFCTHVLSAMVQRVSGQPLTEFLRPRLLDPLGIGTFAWARMAGRDAGAAGLHATTDAMARLGQLHLQGGRWNGRSVLSPDWVAEATRYQIASVGPSDDWRQGYGFQFWRSRHGYRADGLFGQVCLVLPEYDAVIAITGGCTEMPDLLDLVWSQLLPAFDTGSDSARDAALEERLRGLELPLAEGNQAPENWLDWTGVIFRPAGGSCPAQPDLTAVEVAAVPGGWLITVTDYGTRYRLLLEAPGWNLPRTGADVPIAISGGWPDPYSLRLELAFVETPHRLAISCDLNPRTFRAEWHPAPPGGADFDELRSPD